MREVKVKITKRDRLLAAQISRRLPEMIANRRARAEIFTDKSTAGAVYKGARKNKQNENWLVSRETADYELKYGELESLRYRCRQLCKDVPIAEGTVLTYMGMAINRGPTITSKAKNTRVRDAVNQVLANAFRLVDETGDLSLVDTQYRIVSQVCENGDVLKIINYGEERNGIGTQLNLIEADRVMTPAGMETGSVRHGVEYNSNGSIKGFWVFNMPISETMDRYASLNRAKGNFTFYDRVKDGRVVAELLRRPQSMSRPRSSRQVPLFYNCIQLFKDMDDLMDASIVGLRVAACLMAVIESQNPEAVIDGMAWDNATGEYRLDSGDNKYGTMEPGTFLSLAPNEKANLLNPNRGSQEVVATLLYLSKVAAMKVRVPYPVLFLDLERVNYSSYRGGILESRKHFNGWRSWMDYRTITPYCHTVIYEGWLKGMIPAKNWGPDVFDVMISWPPWGNVDPAKEIAAQSTAVANGFTSPQRVCAENGENAEEILDERIEYARMQKEKEDAAGVKLPVPPPPKGAAAAAGGDGDGDQQPNQEKEGENGQAN